MQLLFSPIGNWNFRNKIKLNFTAKRTPHSVIFSPTSRNPEEGTFLTKGVMGKGRLQVVNQTSKDASPSDGEDARHAQRHHHLSHDRLGAQPSGGVGGYGRCGRGQPAAVSGGRPEVVPGGGCGGGRCGRRRAEVQSCDGRGDAPRLARKVAAAGPEDAVLPESQWERDRRQHLHGKSHAGKERAYIGHRYMYRCTESVKNICPLLTFCGIHSVVRPTAQPDDRQPFSRSRSIQPKFTKPKTNLFRGLCIFISSKY